MEGLRVATWALVGDDEEGQKALDSLLRAGCEVRATRLSGRASRVGVVLSTAGGDSAFTQRCGPRTVDTLAAGEVPLDWIQAPHILHLDRSTSLALELARARARAGKVVSLDLHDWPARPEGARRAIEIAKVSTLIQLREQSALSAAAALGVAATPHAILAALEGATQWLAITRGSAGTVAACSSGGAAEAMVKAEPYLDSTGAGDAHAAGLLASWLWGDGLQHAVARAAAWGAQACGWLGARRPPEAHRMG
jgi:sugar/nucleoside kinase (ribokinase family)